MFYVDTVEENQLPFDGCTVEENTSSKPPAPRFSQRSDLLELLDIDKTKTTFQDKSATLKSTNADYNTPPESPVMPHPLFKTIGESIDKPPVPPPRYKRKTFKDGTPTRQAPSPGPSEIMNQSTEVLEEVANDLIRMGDEIEQQISVPASEKTDKTAPTRPAPCVPTPSGTDKTVFPNRQVSTDDHLKGYLHMLVIGAKGLRQMMKTRWFVYDKKAGRLKYYRNEKEEQNGTEPVGDIDVSSATFRYDVGEDNSGEFTICTKMGEFVVSAGTAEKRMYWLQQLQKARREFSAGGASAVRHSVMPHQMGLLKTPEREENPLSPSTNEALKDPSPFKDLMATLEKPADLTAHPGTPVGHFGQLANVTSPPHSAGYLPKKTPNFFQNFTRNRPNFKIPRSSSMRTPSPPGGSSGMLSPGQTKPLGVSSTPGSFQALSKIRKSLRDKKSSSTAGLPSSAGYEPSAGTGNTPSPLGRTFSEVIDHREIANLKEDLQAVREKASADEEVISVLQKQVEELQKEKETLTSLQKDNFDDDHLLEILRTKDTQIVELENSSRDKQVEIDRINRQLEKVQTELTVFRDLLENKDDQIVKLTNQIHEIELKNVMHESVPPSPGGPRTPHLSNLSLHKLQLTGRTSSNGISFDSDRGEFKEFIDVGSQTRQQTSMHGQEVRASEHVTASLSKDAASGDGETTSLPDVEKLQDTVTAYEMQNKFLNKEVLELNQLRQQAIDREQKLFIESSDWEAKFYQIQSKYLLLLNELHNPQAGVSASRQEMVSQLLKDIVEVGDRPTLASKSAAYDRFGFAIETPGNTLEEKAEFLRKQAENNHDNLEDGAEHDEHREKKWDEAIASLNSKTPFTMTTDLKNLLRLGIPISQRCTVWKATVDHKLMRVQNDKFEANYYKKLLANCSSSGQKLTSAAKQIELDLLRTLPNNKHYDGPNADGIPKLRRVLLAYSVHNPDVEYCQGFNRLVAIALLFMAEEDAFWCLVYIIEHLMPAEYYSRDKQLIGAQVDQEVLKELLAEKLPKLQQHFTKHGVDPALFTLNWFLCVFVDTVPVKTYLHIWDAFLFEGSKVLFRYAIAIFKYMETGLLKQGDYMSIYNTLRDGLEYLTDTQTLTQIAFHELNPFPMRTINHKREHHYKVLEAQKKELDHIREEYHRKNSVARTPRSSRDTSGKIEDED